MEAVLVIVVFPLLVANLVHQMVVLRHNFFAFLAIPLDGGFTLRGKRIFGDHKTVRGIVVVSVLTALCVVAFAPFVPFPYAVQPALFGFALGLAYMLGELPNSFAKRQFGIVPGEDGVGNIGMLFSAIDHVDSVCAVAIALFVLVRTNPTTLAVLVLCGGILHYLVFSMLRALGYRK